MQAIARDRITGVKSMQPVACGPVLNEARYPAERSPPTGIATGLPDQSSATQT